MKTIATMSAVGANRGDIHAEDVFDTDIDDLWAACTEPARLARWLAEVSGEPRAGGTVQAAFTSSWSGPVRIETCEPPHHLLLTMEPGTRDEVVLEAWLTAEGDRTRLVVEERGHPLENLHAYGAGWHAHFEDLGRSLDGKAPAWQARWTELSPVYREMAVSAEH